MLPVLLAMAVTTVLALAVVAYVAFPHREKPMPAAPWLGEAMAKARDAAPTLDASETRS